MDSAFFIASKLAGAIVRVDTWLVVILGLIFVAIVLQRPRLARILSAVTFAVVLALTVLPLGDLLLQPLERRFPIEPPLSRLDGIIVLGGGEDATASAHWRQVQLNEGAERYTATLALAKRFPAARILFTGGSGAVRDVAGGVSEASVAARFFQDQGVAPARLVLEDRSRNTTENARLSVALASPSGGEVWVLVTSAFHMPRAIRSFQQRSWPGLVPYPVDFRTAGFEDGIGWNLPQHLEVLNLAVKEWVGLLTYRLTAR